MPTVREVLGVLAMWEAGDLDIHAVQAWAELVVDRVDLPEAADHPAAVRSEVVLQLAALHRIRLGPDDVSRVRRFVRSAGTGDDWSAWFALLAEVARRRRR
jgi:hypothetical protein